MLQQSHPWALLCFASSLLAAVDPRSVDPFQRVQGEVPGGPGLQDLVSSFLDVRLVETTALLTVLAELVPDELVAHRIRRELSRRDDRLPRWLAQLPPIQVDRALQASHVLADGDTIALAVRTRAGHDLTAVVYVDHNLGTLVKDAFVVGEGIDTVTARLREASGADPDTEIRELDLAPARARITQAVEVAAMTYPPLQTDTWPACRPLLEWVVRQLPTGGVGYVRPEWNEADRAGLTERFFASPFARSHATEDRELFESILWFACDYGPGDPLRWSPVAVEILLTDWLPRKLVADPEFLGRAPNLLRSFIRFSHAERGIRETLTAETLAAVDRWEPDYLHTIRTPHPQGPAALLAAIGAFGDGLGGVEFDDEPFSYSEIMLSTLRRAVGSDEVLWNLDTNPLPDEPFAWEAVPDDIHERLAEVLALADGFCDELLDAECRTASRRLLADVAVGAPEIFRRRGRPDTAAAAITWIIAKTNELLAANTGGLNAKRLLAWFGLSGSVSQRAATMLGAIGVEDCSGAGSMSLGTTRYLISARRRTIVERRDRFAATSD